MPRPQVVVTVAAAPPRRGIDSDTGRTFLVYPDTTGPTAPVRCRTGGQARDAGVSERYAQYIADALTEGSPEVVVVRAEVAPADAQAASQSVWANALAKLDVATYGIGQVIIPGVAAPNAHDALVAHAAAVGRTALLDGDVDATASELAAFASAQAAKPGAVRTGLIGGWVKATGTAGVDRTIPGSVIAAGLAGRRDATVGHAGGIPAGTQISGDAGVSRVATDVTVRFTSAEQDSLADAGISPFIQRPGQVLLYNWRSVSSDSRWNQLNFGRLAMQIGYGSAGLLEQFLFRSIDGQGKLFSEVEAALDAYLMQLWQGDALYGVTADQAYDVAVAAVTTIEDIAAGTLRAAVEVAFTPGASKVALNVVVQRAGEVSVTV